MSINLTVSLIMNIIKDRAPRDYRIISSDTLQELQLTPDEKESIEIDLLEYEDINFNFNRLENIVLKINNNPTIYNVINEYYNENIKRN